MDLIGMMMQTPELAALWPGLDAGRHLVTGLDGSAKTLFLAAALKKTQRQLLVVENDRYHADELTADLTGLLGADLVWPFPVEDVLAAEVAVSSKDTVNDRINTLNWLQTGQLGIVVTSLAGLKRQLVPQTTWQQASLTLSMDSEIDPGTLAGQLVAMGYRRDDLVAAPGEFAIRGGIIDIYPLNQDDPVRIELFDTAVDSLRRFDMATQRSIENLEAVTIAPATDLVASTETLKAAGARLTAAGTKAKAKAKTKEAKQALTDELLSVADQMSRGERPDSLALYMPALYPESAQISSYLTKQAVVVYDDYTKLADADVSLLQETTDWYASLQEGGKLAEAQPSLTLQELDRTERRPHLYLSLFQKGMGNIRLKSLTNIATRNVQQFFSQMPLLKTEADRWRKQKQTVVYLVGEKARRDKLSETLRDFDIDAVISEPSALLPGVQQVVAGSWPMGSNCRLRTWW